MWKTFKRKLIIALVEHLVKTTPHDPTPPKEKRFGLIYVQDGKLVAEHFYEGKLPSYITGHIHVPNWQLTAKPGEYWLDPFMRFYVVCHE